MVDEIRCPYCRYTEEECFFPDLYIKDKEQYKLLEELQNLRYNLVTCGWCGEVIILKNQRQV